MSWFESARIVYQETEVIQREYTYNNQIRNTSDFQVCQDIGDLEVIFRVIIDRNTVFGLTDRIPIQSVIVLPDFAQFLQLPEILVDRF